MHKLRQLMEDRNSAALNLAQAENALAAYQVALEHEQIKLRQATCVGLKLPPENELPVSAGRELNEMRGGRYWH